MQRPHLVELMCTDVMNTDVLHRLFLKVGPPVQGLGATLFERLQGAHGGAANTMLTVQYRMHGDVMAWASNEFYGGALTAHASVADHTLADLKARSARQGVLTFSQTHRSVAECNGALSLRWDCQLRAIGTAHRACILGRVRRSSSTCVLSAWQAAQTGWLEDDNWPVSQGAKPSAQHGVFLARQDVRAGGELPVLLLVDTAGCDMEEAAEEEGDSTANPGEAQVGTAQM